MDIPNADLRIPPPFARTLQFIGQSNNSLEHPSGGAGPGKLRQKQEQIEIRVTGNACEGTIPGRSLACLSSPRCLRPKHRQLAAVRF